LAVEKKIKEKDDDKDEEGDKEEKSATTRLGSSTLGKKRKEKVKRRGKLDMVIQAARRAGEVAGEDSDVDEELEHQPLKVHFLRMRFLQAYCEAVRFFAMREDLAVRRALGHGVAE